MVGNVQKKLRTDIPNRGTRVQNVQTKHRAANDPSSSNRPVGGKKDSVKDTGELHKGKTVQGNFDKLSIAGSVGRKLAGGNISGASEQAAVALLGKTVTRKAEVLAKKKRQEKTKTGETIVEEKSKLEGPYFWMIVTFAVLKDLLDVFFTFTVVLMLFSTVFGILVTLLILFYMVFNQIPFSTRKVVSIVSSSIVEILPFASLLPMTTINLFVIRYFDKNEHLKAFIEKKAAALG